MNNKSYYRKYGLKRRALDIEYYNNICNNKIKIFYLYESYLHRNIASATHISELSNNFPKDIEIYFVGPGSDSLLKNNILILKLPIISKLSIFKIIIHILNESLQFGYLLLMYNRYKPKVLLIRSGINISPFIISKLFNTPIVLEVNGLGFAERTLSSKHGLFDMAYNRVMNILEELSLKTSKKIIVVSDGISKGLAKHYNLSLESFITIPNGVNTNLFTVLDSHICKKKVGLKVNYKYICFIGSFAPWHGLEYLVRAAPSIIERVPNAKFILVGEGRTKYFIMKMVENLNLGDSFLFINGVPYNEVPLYINACDVCIILKRKDIPGSPLKLKEYMACGKPVVATKSQDFHILSDYSAGILVDYENASELSNAIVKLLQNQELCEILGKNGRNYVLSVYSWEKIAARVSNVCLDLLHDQSSDRIPKLL